MENITLFLVQDKTQYFYPLEEKCIQPLKMKGIRPFIRKICNQLGIAIPKLFLNKEILKANKIVITDSAFCIGLYKCLKKIFDNRIFLYYMNVINSDTASYMTFFDKENVYSFDMEDAKKYGIRFKHTPYSEKVKLNESNKLYDGIFLGRIKNRDDEIEKIYHLFQKRNLNVKFLVLGSKNKNIELKTYMAYRDYLEYVANSKCIIEINEPNQAGCSLRMMESLFLKKKLITTNKDVKKDSFYNDKNVFILGVDNIERINEFINGEYCMVDVSILKFVNWIENF